MGPLKTQSMRLIVLLVLILPLQGFASVHCVPFDSTASAAHQHCSDDARGAQSGMGPQHHHCGSCCVAAIAITPVRFALPPLTNRGASLPVHWPLLKVALDRLDRPPRRVFS